MIYSFTPYSIEKNFGKAINDCCRIVPNDHDWICIRDGDICNLTPNWGNIIQDAIDEFGHEYQLFGCWTNRLNTRNMNHQLVDDMYDELDIRNHYDLARFIELRAIGITEANKIAGMFMLFQKKTWLEVGGFMEATLTGNCIAFDSNFCDKVRNNGGKIGLINRLYVFHLYRVWSKGNPGLDTKHLQK